MVILCGNGSGSFPTLALHEAHICAHPRIHQVVAFETVGRKTLGLVIGRFGFPVIVHVTAVAFGRQPLPVERSHRPHLVAGVTVDSGMCADQRKAVLMLIDVVNGDLPSGIAMAHVALRTVFAAMNVGVTVLALFAYIREDQVGVAIRTTHLDVHPAQREAGLLVLKLRNSANRLPALWRVAVLAGNPQGSVRAVGTSIGGRLRFISCGEPDLQKQRQMHQQV